MCIRDRNRTKENRWPIIKNLLDDSFKNSNDNRWKTVRNEITNYNEFKQIFKIKYWSESIQNTVRDNLSTGRYDARRGQTMTAYFLGEVWVARHLQPKIPEECLIAKLSYHFGEDIVRARRCGQIKIIGEMEALLEGFERENYYYRSRRRTEDWNDMNNEQVLQINSDVNRENERPQ